MPRERIGFIVTQVWANIAYIDRDGQQQTITKQASARSSDKTKTNLTDAEKQKVKTEHAKRIIRETITELKRSGATSCKGTVSTRILARVGHTDDQGRRRDVIRIAKSRTEAREKIKDILRDLEERGGKTIAASRLTFADLATHFEKHYLKPAEYVDGRKIEGVRSLVPAQAAVNALRRYFGKRRLQSLSYGDIRSYRAARLKEPTTYDLARHKRELEHDRNTELRVTRSIATVNRELSKLRRGTGVEFEKQGGRPSGSKFHCLSTFLSGSIPPPDSSGLLAAAPMLRCNLPLKPSIPNPLEALHVQNSSRHLSSRLTCWHYSRATQRPHQPIRKQFD